MQRNYTKFNLISLLIIVLSLFLLVGIFQNDQPDVDFKDPGLEAAVRAAIGKKEGKIEAKDVELLQELDAVDYEIKSLEGIGALAELRELDLEDNFVESVAPLEETPKLEKLNLRNNGITSLEDIDFEEILFLNIRNLSLRHNVVRDEDGEGTRLSDISLLGQMVSLRKLKLRDNHIEDLSPISNLRNLKELDVRENKFTTIEPLETLTRLEKLNIRENEIESLEPIAYLSRLEYLNIHSDTDIQSLDPIKNLVNLETLIMRNVDTQGEADFLHKLTKLQRLNAIDTGIETADASIFEDLRAKGALTGEVRPIRMLHTLEAPEFSEDSGFYTEGFDLELDLDSDAQQIYYTLDGSEPTLESKKYTDPLSIEDIDDNTATVVRAKVLTEDNKMSETVTKTYFVNENIDERFTLPVFSLVTDPDNLFDEEIGIYAEDNYENRGSDWERPVHIEFFEENGERGLNQNGGIRIHGRTTRVYDQKSFRLYADSEYDEESLFNYPLLGDTNKIKQDEKRDTFKRILLRNSGQDRNSTFLRDGFMQSLVAPLDTVETQGYQPTVIMMNGEYWGILNIRERYDEYYLENTHGVSEDDITILQNNAELYRGKNKNVTHYKKMIDYIKENGLSNDEHYSYIKTQMDTENFRDYLVTETYFGNPDWPGNNIRYWRKNTDQFEKDAPYGHDGRWRWLMFDLDFGFARSSNEWGDMKVDVTHNTIDWAMSKYDHVNGTKTWPNFLIRSLMENNEFKNDFLNRYNDLVNSHFLDYIIIDQLEDAKEKLQPEMPNQIERWEAIDSMDNWENNFDTMKNFAEERPTYIYKYIMEEFDIEDTITISVGNETDRGHVKLNTIDINDDLPGNTGEDTWSGTYFSEVPITLEAVAKEGYEFSHWEGIEENSERVELTPTTDLNIKAVFTPKE